MNLSSLIKESLAVQSDAFIETVEKAISLLRGENGKIGHMEISGRLVQLEPSGEALVIYLEHSDRSIY